MQILSKLSKFLEIGFIFLLAFAFRFNLRAVPADPGTACQFYKFLYYEQIYFIFVVSYCASGRRCCCFRGRPGSFVLWLWAFIGLPFMGLFIRWFYRIEPERQPNKVKIF